MIHRPFLLLSFRSPLYAKTRATCVAAAKTILRHHARTIEKEHVSIWTHSAFCITATIVLGLEMFHRTNHQDEDAVSYRTLIIEAKDRLSARVGDVVAERGAALIATILRVEHETFLANRLPGNVDFWAVIDDFLSRHHPSFAVDTGGAVEVGASYQQPYDIHFDYLDTWFNQAFGSM